MVEPPPFPYLAVALDGAGWHPAAWREPSARPTELSTARYCYDLVAEAERGLLDFVTIEDSLGWSSTGDQDSRIDQVRGRLDAVLIAARVAPLTRHIGLVPTVVVTHTEPFHSAKAIATLDYVSTGRAGVRVEVAARAADAGHFGRRTVPPIDELWDEAGDYVEVVRRLWDSWEDGAEIRDVATGRFIDREKLHYIDFAGRWFNVRGPVDHATAAAGPTRSHRAGTRERGVPVPGSQRGHRIRDTARPAAGSEDRRADRSTSRTRWPGSSPASITSPAAGRRGTWHRRGFAPHPSSGRNSKSPRVNPPISGDV